MSVRRFLLRRLVLVVPILLGITFLTFMLVRIGEQSPVAMLGGPMADQATFAIIEEELGLDRPFFVQFGIYLGKLVQGDLGDSWQSSERVADEIRNRLPASLELLIFSVLLGALIGVPVGLRSAQRPNGLFDQVSRFVSLFGFSVPTYWIALMSIFVFFFLLRWSPPPMGRLNIMSFPPPRLTGSYFIDSIVSGNWSTAWSALGHLTLPVILFSIIVAAPIIKHTRAIALEVLSSDYARAQGLRPKTVRRIALRNAIVPILTFIGTELTGLLAAVSLLELIFAWGGLGQWGLNAILLGDFAAVQGYVLVLAVFSVSIFVVIDLLVLVLEPRATLRS
ncbi:MAG: ABC transporter permease [Proteobacteria bacterium]|nr:ABC transporter permease [Pseudomonadota bacterium]